MNEERQSRPPLTLDLDPRSDSIGGTLRRGDGTQERFWGWLELMSVIERMARSDQTEAGGNDQCSSD